MRIRSRTPESEELIDMSPLLDVLFILIIFFLLTTTFREEEIDHEINLPVDARNQSTTNSANALIKINIRESGAYIYMGRQVTEEQIDLALQQEVIKRPEVKVLIRCDQEAKHLYLANVMSICRHQGVAKANIAVKTDRN